MSVYEKIRFMRMFKGWSQEEMANRLGMVVGGYSKIERGETDIRFSKLQQIAKTFEIELSDLIGLNEKNVFNFIGNFNDLTSSKINCTMTTTEYEHELEKANLTIEHLREQIDSLKEMIEILKKD